jgi:hypothetical protein
MPDLGPDWLFAGEGFCVQALRMESASASVSTLEGGSGGGAGKRRTLTVERAFCDRSVLAIVLVKAILNDSFGVAFRQATPPSGSLCFFRVPRQLRPVFFRFVRRARYLCSGSGIHCKGSADHRTTQLEATAPQLFRASFDPVRCHLHDKSFMRRVMSFLEETRDQLTSS